MRTFVQFLGIALVALLFFVTGAVVAFGQVPSHTPGSICATPTFWCWVQPYGVYGQPCVCPTAYGDVAGVYV